MNKVIELVSINRHRWNALFGILFLGLLLRLWGIDFGLPFLVHPDEARYVIYAQNLFKTWDFDPDLSPTRAVFQFFYLLQALAYVPFYFLTRAAGVVRSAAAIPSPAVLTIGVGKTAMSSTFLLGRLVSLSFGLGIVLLTGLNCRCRREASAV